MDTAIRETASRPAYVDVTIRYIDPDEELPLLNSNDHANSKKKYDVRPVRIHDARRRDDLSLDTSGFILLREPTAVRNFHDPEEVQRVFHPEVDRVVKRLTGADQVIIFGPVLRSSGAAPNGGTVKEPSVAAHVDLTIKSLRDQIVLSVGEEAAKPLLKRDFVNLNLWRPLKRVESKPLCLCDAATVDRDDDMKIAGIINSFRKPGDPPSPYRESYNMMYRPRHRWYYVPDMEPDEMLVFKLADTRNKQLCPHTAFDDPNSPPGAPPRESFEIRTIAFI